MEEHTDYLGNVTLTYLQRLLNACKNLPNVRLLGLETNSKVTAVV